jgi:hypothetical protein
MAEKPPFSQTTHGALTILVVGGIILFLLTQTYWWRSCASSSHQEGAPDTASRTFDTASRLSVTDTTLTTTTIARTQTLTTSPSPSPKDGGPIDVVAVGGSHRYLSTVTVNHAQFVANNVVVVVSIANRSDTFLSYVVFDRSVISGDSEKYFLLDARGTQHPLTGIDQPHEDLNVPFLPMGDSMSVLEIAPGAHREYRVSFACSDPATPLMLLHTGGQYSGSEFFVKGQSARLPNFRVGGIGFDSETSSRSKLEDIYQGVR